MLVQLLVNKWAEGAFALKAKNPLVDDRINKWFDTFWSFIRRIMNDPKLTPEFDPRTYSFLLTNSAGYTFDFYRLSDGYSAALDILAQVMLRCELARPDKEEGGDPDGVVLIDEIETHLHLRLQSDILPFLTTLYPRLQFIVATHSPLVISSIDDAVVYDLASRKEVDSDALRGIRFGALMMDHFGLNSEFDEESTELLSELRRLARLGGLDESQQARLDELADSLSKRSDPLAVEVWLATSRRPGSA